MKLSSARLDFEGGRLDQSLLKEYSEAMAGSGAGTSAGSSYTIDLSQGNVVYLLLDSATCTLTFPTGTMEGAMFTLFLRQDDTGGRQVSWPTVRWSSNDSAPTLSTAPRSLNTFTFTTPDSGATWFGVYGGTEHPLLDDGILGWGVGTGGQLGENNAVSRSTPVQTLSNQVGWSKIGVGGLHAAGVKKNGTLWAWGNNAAGQLGQVINATTASSPVQVGPDKTWASVSGGFSGTVAITTAGAMWAWGLNGAGQLGQNSVTPANVSSPVQVASDKTWASVALSQHVVAITATTGQLWAWGLGTSGQLGLITAAASASSPVQVASDKTWSSVACGNSHTAAITTNGELWAWGINSSGQLGQISNIINRSSPVQVASDKTWRVVTSGGYTTAAITTTGQLWAWGLGTGGPLGQITSVTNRSSPVQVASDKTWSSVACGASHTVAVTTTGELWAWGLGTTGQLGDYTAVSKSSPVQVGTSTKWLEVESASTSGSSFGLYDF